jgi:ElaB/YqjD/DUF883 family membrane-anchored ribosome-binding protein
MDPEPDVIRQQIEETRSALTDKLETLEAEVKGTVQSARDTVDNVKETVHNAKESVKRTFDIPYQVDRHPFAMLGLSFVSGVVAGALVGGQITTGRRLSRRMAEASYEPPQRRETGASLWSHLTHAGDGRPGFVDRLGQQLGGEMEKVKDLAIDTLVGVVGDVARRAIPELGRAAEQWMSRAAAQVGAPPQQYGPEHRESATGHGYQTPPQY